MTVAPEALIRALKPIYSRVRRDVTAVKYNGRMAWTNDALNLERMVAHVTGGTARGVCPIEAGQSVTRLGLLDFDSHGGETPWGSVGEPGTMVDAADRVCRELDAVGLQPIAFRSSGGRGLHVFVLWDEPQDAYSVRQCLTGALGRAGFTNGARGVSAGQAEVFPKQDAVGVGEYGNQFILPLAGASEPLDILFGFEPMGREAVVGMDWPVSAPVPVLERPVRERAAGGGDPEPLDKLRAALFAIPNDGGDGTPDYDKWRDLCFAVHEATGGSQDGLDVFLEWSAQNPRHDEKFATERVWDYIKPADVRSDGGITRGTLYHLAGLHGWSGAPAPDADGFEDVPQEDMWAAAQAIAAENEAKEERQALALREKQQDWLRRIQSAETVEDLQVKVARKIAAEKMLGAVERQLLANALKERFDSLGAHVTVGLCRELVAYKSDKPKPPTVTEALPLTEFGNTERMLNRYGDSLMFVPETARWYVWNGNHWEKCVGNEVQIEHMAKETIRALVEEAKGMDDERLAEFFEFCKISQRAVMVRNMVTLASSSPQVVVPAKELDKHKHLLGVRNGVVDLRTGALLPPSKELRITMVAACDYNPKAAAPRFLATLKDVFFHKEDMVDFFTRCIGYSAMGNPKEEVLFIPFGNGANGKGTLLNTIRITMGDYAASASADSFVSDGKGGGNAGGAREDLVRLRGRRFVYVNEPDENGELREGSVKSMTGNDAITARGLFSKDSVEILPSWVVFMPTNHKPIVKGSDNGIWRRLILLPFERDFENDKTIRKDPNLKEKLLGEMEGVLAWIVRAAMSYQQVGLTQPAEVKAARDSYRTQMDLLAEWLDECCEVNGDASETMQRLWLSWEQFAKNRGILNYVRSSTALGRRLDQKFASFKGTGGVRMRRGVRLKSDLVDF